MKTFPGFGSVHPRLWPFAALSLFFLSACALTPGSGEENTPNTNTVDIGYGTVDKDHQVGSVTTIEGKDVMADRSRTLGDMLARVPGVRVSYTGNGDLRVRIRASNSILGGEDPLFVVDGMVFNGGVGSINPNTIESISVLKNAGETAIYGSRGANGVILIRTKTGGK